MLIDWFTVGAQALNFIILVWLLKRFLYKPILDAVDAREKRIAAELADADKQKDAARMEREEFQRKNEVFVQQRDELLKTAIAEAQGERQRLLEEARRAADVLSTKRQEALHSDAKALNQALRRQIQQEVFAIARKALTDLSGASLEERISEVFTQRLRSLDSKAKETLGAALEAASEPAFVRSAFQLSEAQQASIRRALNETFAADVPVRFETAPDLVAGIELLAHGQKLGWSISDYLTSLEKGLGTLLDAQAKPTPLSQPKPS
ncbi:MAG: F0F1 ATP synthase subunit delta [Steroidobacteraceae bacterium]